MPSQNLFAQPAVCRPPVPGSDLPGCPRGVHGSLRGGCGSPWGGQRGGSTHRQHGTGKQASDLWQGTGCQHQRWDSRSPPRAESSSLQSVSVPHPLPPTPGQPETVRRTRRVGAGGCGARELQIPQPRNFKPLGEFSSLSVESSDTPFPRPQRTPTGELRSSAQLRHSAGPLGTTDGSARDGPARHHPEHPPEHPPGHPPGRPGRGNGAALVSVALPAGASSPGPAHGSAAATPASGERHPRTAAPSRAKPHLPWDDPPCTPRRLTCGTGSGKVPARLRLRGLPRPGPAPAGQRRGIGDPRRAGPRLSRCCTAVEPLVCRQPEKRDEN